MALRIGCVTPATFWLAKYARMTSRATSGRLRHSPSSNAVARTRASTGSGRDRPSDPQVSLRFGTPHMLSSQSLASEVSSVHHWRRQEERWSPNIKRHSMTKVMNARSIVAGLLVFGMGLPCACTEERTGDASSKQGGIHNGTDSRGGTERDCLPSIAPECVEHMCRGDNRDCGSISSIFDATGCYRSRCSGQQDCGSMEECREVEYAPPSCGYVDESTCACGSSGAIITESFCFPLADDQDKGATVRTCLPSIAPGCVVDLCRKENRDCGSASSVFDADGCYRRTCSSEDDCGSGEKCMKVDYAPPSCGYADDSSCICGSLGAIVTESFCFPDTH